LATCVPDQDVLSQRTLSSRPLVRLLAFQDVQMEALHVIVSWW